MVDGGHRYAHRRSRGSSALISCVSRRRIFQTDALPHYHTLPPLALSVDSLYAWGSAIIEGLACIAWTFGFGNLSPTRNRGDEATGQHTWRLARAAAIDG